MKVAIAIVAKEPVQEWINFLSQIEGDFHTFLFSDMPTTITDEKTHIIHYTDERVARNWFTCLSHFKPISAWDKALYHFCKVETDFDHVWFLEDDVLIPHAKTLQYLQAKYPTGDLLIRSCLSFEQNTQWQHWHRAIPRYARYQSMACVCRTSKKLLREITNLANERRRLFFLELLFTSVAAEHKMHVLTIPELQHIIWKYEWKQEDIQPDKLYHPVKNFQQQQDFRKNIHTQ